MHTIPIFSEKRCQLIYNNRNTDIGERYMDIKKKVLTISLLSTIIHGMVAAVTSFISIYKV